MTHFGLRLVDHVIVEIYLQRYTLMKSGRWVLTHTTWFQHVKCLSNWMAALFIRKSCLFLVSMIFPFFSMCASSYWQMLCSHQNRLFFFFFGKCSDKGLLHGAVTRLLGRQSSFSVSFLLLSIIALWYDQTLGSGKLPWITLQLCSLCHQSALKSSWN